MTDDDKKALALRLRQIRDNFGVMFESPRLNGAEKEILLQSLEQLAAILRELGFKINVGREGQSESSFDPGTRDSPNGWKGYL